MYIMETIYILALAFWAVLIAYTTGRIIRWVKKQKP